MIGVDKLAKRRNAFIAAWKCIHVELGGDGRSREVPNEETVEDLVILKEKADLLHDAIRSLPEPQRAVMENWLLRCAGSGALDKEGAKAQKIPASRVRYYQGTGCRRLRSALGASLGGYQ